MGWKRSTQVTDFFRIPNLTKCCFYNIMVNVIIRSYRELNNDSLCYGGALCIVDRPQERGIDISFSQLPNGKLCSQKTNVFNTDTADLNPAF